MRRRVVLAFVVAGAIALGAVGTAGAYYLLHAAKEEQVAVREFRVEVAPEARGPYELYLPLPLSPSGLVPQGFALRTQEGSPDLAIVDTEHGLALRVRGDGPAKMVAEGPLPLRLSLDDATFSFRQFRFWTHLGPPAQGPVLVKVELRERAHEADWERHLDTGRAVLLQQALQPAGWQLVRATQLFDVSLGEGYRAEFPRLALGAVAAALSGFYVPLGLVLSGWKEAPATTTPPSTRTGPTRPGPR